jgi:cytochrome c peroxidase
MANSWPNVLAVLAKDADLVAAFTASYGDAPFANQKAAMDAIVTYERSLVTPSRFDDWLRGDERALSHAERIGYQRFKEVGCVGCHNGINVGGASFAKLGLMGDYFADRAAKGRGAPNELDKGRILTTKNAADLHVFRVAPLRNVALTAPYFHDGAVPTLDEAIELMARFQLGRELSPLDRSLIAAFLGSLSGKHLEQR